MFGGLRVVNFLFHLFHTVSLLANENGSALFQKVKRPGREADHSYPSIADVKIVWSLKTTLSILRLKVLGHWDNIADCPNVAKNWLRNAVWNMATTL
jgi:hypothetical protein